MPTNHQGPAHIKTFFALPEIVQGLHVMDWYRSLYSSVAMAESHLISSLNEPSSRSTEIERISMNASQFTSTLKRLRTWQTIEN